MKSEIDTHNVVSKKLLAVAGGGWCVYVFRGFGCEVEGVTGAFTSNYPLNLFLHHKDVLQV